jgi:Fur family transcriptional regulator, ferric uptake regulator
MNSKKSFRDTKQRHAIKRALDLTGRPLGPKEILSMASKEVPNLGIATVYRNIKTMVEKGELVAVDLPGQAPRYQAPENKSTHLFVDTATDSVYNITPDLGSFPLSLPEEFEVENFQIFVYGSYSKKKRSAKKKTAEEG